MPGAEFRETRGEKSKIFELLARTSRLRGEKK